MPRKSIPNKTNTKLLMEVKLQCPFCGNPDAEHFQTHHIDENTENNDFTNLIKLCPTCHSKVTKNDISQIDVRKVKERLGQKEIKQPFEKEEVESEFPGGDNTFRKFLRENLQYPKEAIEGKISGTVVVQFTVDRTGLVKAVEALDGPVELRAEAVRVIQKSARWLPAQQNGLSVKSYKKQPIVFKLEQKKGLFQSLFHSV